MGLHFLSMNDGNDQENEIPGGAKPQQPNTKLVVINSWRALHIPLYKDKKDFNLVTLSIIKEKTDKILAFQPFLAILL